MRKLFLIFVLSMCVLFLAVDAQAADSFEKEFQAFKEKLNKSTNAIKEKTIGKKSPDIETSSIRSNGSPLGPAGRLPVRGQPPATSAAVRSKILSPQQMRDQARKEIEKQRQGLEKEYFNDAVKTLMPLTPEQIREMLETFRQSREAAETPIFTPKPRTEVNTVSLDPSAQPLVIKTAPGYVTTMTIVDATGAPWAIQDVSWAGDFQVTGPESGGHIVRIVPGTAHGAGNLSIRLIDLTTPIIFSLKTGLKEVHYRFDVRVPQAGPLAKTSIIEYGGIDTVVGKDDNLVSFLEGTPPERSQELIVNGVDARTRAWKSDDGVYLRTPLTLLSPAWNSSVTSSDGMHVYTIKNSPVVILSDKGRMVEAYISTERKSDF